MVYCGQAVMAGDYILSVASTMLARIRNEEVLVVLSQVSRHLPAATTIPIRICKEGDFFSLSCQIAASLYSVYKVHTVQSRTKVVP